MAETGRPKLANLVSIVFILATIGIIILAYIFFLKPLSAGPSMSSLISRFSFLLTTTEGILAFLSWAYIPSLLSLQMSSSTYLLLFVASIIMAVILVVSAFGFAYRKKWGYYLAILSSLILIITPVLGYIVGISLIYIVGSVIFAILGVLFILYLRGDVKKEF